MRGATLDEGRLRRLEGASRGGVSVDPGLNWRPNIIEFALDERYLGVRLYPRQATLLKLLFCSPSLLTDYDRQVLAEWTAGFTRRVRDDGTSAYVGSYGVVCDVLDRIEWCHADGRGWFREVIMVAGRRGSKGFLGAVATSYIVWNVMATLDPPAHYGIAKGKQIHVLVFAGQHHQAQINQWRDLVQVIGHSACFRRYIASESRDTLWLYSPAQLAAGDIAPKDAAFVVSAREATELAGRGQASLAQLFDEMAHMEAGGANRSAEEIYSSASPGTAQFGTDAFLYQASSPWTQQGKFYAQYQRGLAIDPVTRTALDPDMLVVQLPSADLYRDWERTHDPDFLAWPEGQPFRRLEGPIFDAGDQHRLRRADPDGYDVEFGAQWAATQAAYLQREDVDRLFAPYRGSPLPMATTGSPEFSYIAHADPSVTGANFALVVAHAESDDDGQRHVIIDLIQVWRPQDFADRRIDYEYITAQLETLLCRFRLTHLTFDQYNSAGLMARLHTFRRTDTRVLGNPSISERTATGPYNHRVAETFKAALGRRLVHAPVHDLAEVELRNLEVRNGRVDHPTRGPVQTSDIADCLMAVVDELLGDNNGLAIHQALGATGIRGVATNDVHRRLGQFGRSDAAGATRGDRYDPSRSARRPGRGRW